MREIKRLSKVVGLDILAVLCFIGVILFGWLPGPGGIPLFLAGLALLAINHTWAKRLLEKARKHSKNAKKFFFPDWAWARYAYDSFCILLSLTAIYLLYKTEDHFIAAVSVALICFSVGIFLINRDRLDNLNKFIKKIKT